jgi:hypothetical protein
MQTFILKTKVVLGLGMFVDRRLPPSSRHHESGVWQGLYRLEVEVVSDSTIIPAAVSACIGVYTHVRGLSYNMITELYTGLS